VDDSREGSGKICGGIILKCMWEKEYNNLDRIKLA
jgi:hypothetical protein